MLFLIKVAIESAVYQWFIDNGLLDDISKSEYSGFPLFDILPSWVIFPDIERAEWANCLLARVWPFIAKYITNSIKDKVEPKVGLI